MSSNRNGDPVLSKAKLQLQSASPKFAKHCEHLGSSLRPKFLSLHKAIMAENASTASEIFQSIMSSELITGTTAKLHDIKEDINNIKEALVPWIKTIGGLVAALAGYFIVAELGIFWAALLVIGGFLYAIITAWQTVYKTGMTSLQH